MPRALTNGRGASRQRQYQYSQYGIAFKRRRSLAVRRVLYAITAALHFTKQVPRCMRNHEDKVWDKFEMSVLHGNTLGLVGYGDIAN